MSAEIVTGDDGRLYVLTDGREGGCDVCPVGDPMATYERKFVARHAVRFGCLPHTEDGAS